MTFGLVEVAVGALAGSSVAVLGWLNSGEEFELRRFAKTFVPSVAFGAGLGFGLEANSLLELITIFGGGSVAGAELVKKLYGFGKSVRKG